MAEVWVLHRTPEETLKRQRHVSSQARKARSRLVRADTIPYLRADEDAVVAQWHPGSEDVVTLADRKNGDEELPFDFHLELLAAIAAARKAAQEADEDQVLVAEFDDGEWSWKSYRLSELT
ncbi:hypothetical protein ACFYZ8_34265 [Streptomyces sp. NPDC001668]|uniref:hypothetical protein n=1 Tax=Streptomyces sp. NPDC001668 TaxID=3364598 RepID=UPI0036813BE1